MFGENRFQNAVMQNATFKPPNIQSGMYSYFNWLASEHAFLDSNGM